MMAEGIPEVNAIAEDFPPAMIEEWMSSWGKEITMNLVKVLSQEPPLSLRANLKTGQSVLLKDLTQGSRLPVKAELSSFAPFGVRLSGYAPVLASESYKSGCFEIQDEGSQLMALFALSPSKYGRFLKSVPAEVEGRSPVKMELWDAKQVSRVQTSRPLTVIDACAGAGGKTLAMADALKGKGRVYAYDTSEKKLQALRRRVTRANLNNVQAVLVQEGQEEKAAGKFKKTADIVLVDAPCSGWGVLRRNPDIKWRQNQETLDRMPLIQLRLLSFYASLVAPGGHLVFGVCTFRKSETLEVCEKFLKSHSEFTELEGGFLGPGPCDGFFMQAFRRSLDSKGDE